MRYDHTHFNAQRAYGGAINERIGNFLPMVRKLAWYYEGSGGAAVDVDDLIQAGMIALTECAQRHDRPGEDGFAAYAKMRVRGAMIDLLRAQSPHARGAAGRLRRIDAAVQQRHVCVSRLRIWTVRKRSRKRSFRSSSSSRNMIEPVSRLP